MAFGISVTALTIPCPGCGHVHAFKPGEIRSRHCDACRYYWCASEWRASFLAKITPAREIEVNRATR